ncbi:MAG: hypothetical protein U0Q11_16185 [Vicinamibacterales bacterium]
MSRWHFDFVEPSKRYADLIIPQGGHNDIAIDLLLNPPGLTTRQQSPTSTPTSPRGAPRRARRHPPRHTNP